MIKKILIIFILPFLFQGCGYSTLYSNNNDKNINIEILGTKGDQEINNYILHNIRFIILDIVLCIFMEVFILIVKTFY